MKLTSRPQDVNNRYFLARTPVEGYNPTPEDWEVTILEDLKYRLLEEQRSRQLVRRTIFNRYYMGVNKQSAYEYLKEQPVGSCVFRPSPTGLDQLILTYKVGILGIGLLLLFLFCSDYDCCLNL